MKNLDDFLNALANSPTLGTAAHDPTGAVSSIRSLDTIYDAGQAAGFGFHTDPTTGALVADNPGAQQALQAFADLRNQYYEAFMNNPTNVAKFGADAVTDPSITHIDAFVFPTLNYIAPVQNYALPYTSLKNPTTNYGSLPARFEGNILGVPGLAVPMGYATSADGTSVPMSLEFMGHFDGEGPLIGMAYDYEQHTEYRTDPNLAALPNPTLFGDFLNPIAAIPEPRSLVLAAISSFVGGVVSVVRRRGVRGGR
jgi:hypothetical protein